MNQLRTPHDLSDQDRRLLEAAREASAHAYAPYSSFAVGAAVRTQSGRIFCGANLENAAFGTSICAEVAAVAGANTAGDLDIEAIAIVGHKFTSPPDSSHIVMPCGRCRQVISEAALASGVDIRLLSCDGDLKQVIVSSISALLPSAFGPENLTVDQEWRLALANRVRVLSNGSVAARSVDIPDLN